MATGRRASKVAENNPYEQFQAPANPYDQFNRTTEEEAAADPELEETAPGVWRKIGGGLDAAAQIATGIVAEPVAGLVGLAGAAVDGVDAGVEGAQAAREALTWEAESELGREYLGDVASFMAPVGEAFGAVEEGLGGTVAEATGSPELATAAHVAPTALLEALGLGLLRKPSKLAQQAADAQERVRVSPSTTPEELAQELVEPENRSPDQIAETLRKHNDPGALAEEVRPDAEIMAAAEDLGVSLNPGHYSTNEAYIRVEQAVKSQPRSQLAAREADALAELGDRADDLIGEMGGTLDRSLLEAELRNRMDGTIKELEQQASKYYRQVNENIPPATKVDPKASMAYIEARLEQMGGDVSGLSTAEKQLHSVMSQDKPPTYARLDQLRRDVGAGYKRQGPFKDDVSGNLDQVYAVLSTDQNNIAKAMGVGPVYEAGRKLVSQRKDIEAQALKLFGNQMEKSFLPKLTQSATALTKGDVQQFRNLMNALPENMRVKAAATMLNDLFAIGRRGGNSIGAGFATAYRALDRNKQAKAELFKYMPEYAQRRFNALGKVSQGIYRAKALENTSKTARDLLQAIESGEMARKLDSAADTILGRMTFVPGPTRWLATGAKVAKSKVKETFDRKKAADELMISNDFNRAINKAMEGKVKEAEIMLKRSKAWQKFRNTLGEGTKQQLAAAGIIPWLTSQEEPEPGGQ